jgi:trans-aconitate 2-methyltransferase
VLREWGRQDVRLVPPAPPAVGSTHAGPTGTDRRRDSARRRRRHRPRHGELLEHLPRGRVIAVDGSLKMLAQLRRRIGDDSRLTVLHADLTKPLPLDTPVSAVFSVATFHWISDHESLFNNLAAHLQPGGRLVAECGGVGNVASIARAVEGVLGHSPNAWTFAGQQETREQLERAGFEDIEVELVPDPARLEAGEQFATFLAAVVLGGHLERLPEREHETFIAGVAAQLPEPVVDFVRLCLRATRSSTRSA